ncbi:carboxymuconolactone decarboxylase family protein [Pseudofrankia sp. BMG5.36]|uniref:carboxymuconolactone decarboxylase family protein n=1 Tax=Pseudofrankia sp. BMG5.36 TaxID=1834512 RepID=UPI0009F5C3F8|nr:carboxymuconolactone decarboxylase family protein [Pseudofrankia sp. BMG5.36]
MRELLSWGTPDGQPRRAEYLTTLVRHPRLYRQYARYATFLLTRGTLPGRDRELAVLRNAWLCRGQLEWGEHVEIAREVGLTTAEIEQVIAGPDHEAWAPDDAAIIRAVDELHADSVISDETWAILAQRLDAPQLIELIQLVGTYAMTAWLQNSLRVLLRPGNAGLAAR